jgi:hypothetical protein
MRELDSVHLFEDRLAYVILPRPVMKRAALGGFVRFDGSEQTFDTSRLILVTIRVVGTPLVHVTVDDMLVELDYLGHQLLIPGAS